uniref:Uncharacterized protein n=1 Tax=Panagrellus redivivus TaxID=6233 RepID=A0A7E4ZZJ9_PANRE
MPLPMFFLEFLSMSQIPMTQMNIPIAPPPTPKDTNNDISKPSMTLPISTLAALTRLPFSIESLLKKV